MNIRFYNAKIVVLKDEAKHEYSVIDGELQVKGNIISYIGDGSDSITDIMYCVNFVFISLSVLTKLPAHKRHAVNMDKVNAMYQKIRRFLLRIQIASPFA